MLKQIKLLTKLELCNIYNLNVLRFSKNSRRKKKELSVMTLWLFLIVMLIFYVSNLSYGLLKLELGSLIPAYLITVASLLIFFFGIFKAGNIIFRKNGYDILCSLPINRTAIVVGRFLRLYVENLVIAFLIVMPGLFVYAWFLKPGAAFYVLGALSILILPLVPITASILIGAVIMGISSRMKHKSLTAAGLSVLFVLLFMYGSSRLSIMEETITPEMLRELSSVIMGTLEKVYPPAVWLGRAVIAGSFMPCFICTGAFLAVFAAAAAIVSIFFHSINQSLFTTSARHNYELKTLKKSSVLSSLCKREFRRYFSSSIYVTNTIIGPIMGCILSGALLFTGTDVITKSLPVPLDIRAFAPFVFSGIFCMMTTTATSISMEGKNWWILKSLPLSPKSVLNAKILMNLLLMLPFYLISEALLIPALKPETFFDGVFLLLIPAVIILFSCVYGIAVNLHFPVLNWENEITIVKQSISAILGGMGGVFLSALCAVIIFLIPQEYYALCKALICIFILVATVLLHKRITAPDAWRRYEL